MVGRPCLERGCPELALRGQSRCQRHRQTTTQKGYGTDHQRRRAVLSRGLPARCAYGCGTLLRAGDDWVAAHVVDGDPASRRVVSCRSCNERAKGVGPLNLWRFRGRRLTLWGLSRRLQVPPAFSKLGER